MKETRRDRFSAYFKERLGGDRARLMQRTGYTKGRISQLLDKREPFGELAAARLASKLGLPTDYFERDHAPGEAAPSVQLTEPEKQWLQAFRDLPAARAQARLAEIEAEAKVFRDYVAERRPYVVPVDDAERPSDGYAGTLAETKNKPPKKATRR